MVPAWVCMAKGKESCSAAQTQGRCTHIPGTVALKYSMVPPAAQPDQRPAQEAEKDHLGTFFDSFGKIQAFHSLST